MVAIKDMEMPSCCKVCDFRKSDPFSGEVYCNKAVGSNAITYEDEKLENCPLIEIEERKVSKWIDGGRIDKGTFKRYKCSNCQDNVYEKEYLIKYHKYCLHCGAEMVGAENG